MSLYFAGKIAKTYQTASQFKTISRNTGCTNKFRMKVDLKFAVNKVSQFFSYFAILKFKAKSVFERFQILVQIYFWRLSNTHSALHNIFAYSPITLQLSDILPAFVTLS